MRLTRFKILIGLLVIFLFFPLGLKAVYVGESQSFYIDASYDLKSRDKITAILRRITPKIYFYIDDSWWNMQDQEKREDVEDALQSLGSEFNYKIYPTLSTIFGSEWFPGIDGDEKITVLLHSMDEGVGGYFNSADEYLKLQVPTSNEREMFYINVDYITDPIAKSFLAHEFVHLITFNQKEKLRKVSEEIWLNESRAEYAPTFLGYNDIYKGSNLQKRVNNFLESSSDSLTEWQNTKADYGVINLFTHYLVDHYGIEILSDSMQTREVGISSINYALSKNGFEEDFAQVFTDWTIATFLNDCGSGPKYCYLNENLKNFRIVPLTNFLPISGKSSLSVTYHRKDWSSSWYKFVGGTGTLEIEFLGDSEASFQVPYSTEDLLGKRQVSFFQLDDAQYGKISIAEFRTNIISVTIIPSIQTKKTGFSSLEPSFPFSWTASIEENNSNEENNEPEKGTENSESIQNLLAQVESLKEEIARVQAEIDKILGHQPYQLLKEIPNGFAFTKNLSQGIKDDDVVYLKTILDKEVEHESWLGTSYFGLKTLNAVKKFQEKYKTEISDFVGYEISCTGFVGKGTKAKLNEILEEVFS